MPLRTAEQLDSMTKSPFPGPGQPLGLSILAEGSLQVSSLSGGHVTTGNLQDISSFGCVCFVVGYFPDFVFV